MFAVSDGIVDKVCSVLIDLNPPPRSFLFEHEVKIKIRTKTRTITEIPMYTKVLDTDIFGTNLD